MLSRVKITDSVDTGAKLLTIANRYANTSRVTVQNVLPVEAYVPLVTLIILLMMIMTKLLLMITAVLKERKLSLMMRKTAFFAMKPLLWTLTALGVMYAITCKLIISSALDFLKKCLLCWFLSLTKLDGLVNSVESR